jgi:N-hydroxyarylamine O-acetyltransferase
MNPNELDAYFARVGFTGTHTDDLACLRALQLAQVSAIPFENLDVLLGRRISLKLDAIFRKLVTDRRGGYCFEQNSLLRDVLTTLGFKVTPLLARVRWQVPATVQTPLTHMVLVVTLDDRRWLVDAGFGSVGATAPLELEHETPQVTSHDTRRLIMRDGSWVHQLLAGDTWADVYQFRPEEPAPMDFEMGNHFSCTHPQARFVNNLVVSRVLPDGRVTLFNRELTRREINGRAETSPLQSAEALLVLLAQEFDLTFPCGTRFGAPGSAWPT